MTIEQQFQAILQKAIDKGWDICGFLNQANCDHWEQGIHQWQNVVDLEIYYLGHKKVIQQDTIYFNHGFARAFFGNSYIEEIRELATIPPDKRLEVLYDILKGGEK